MALDDLTPERIRSFLAVARHLNFTRAAEEVHLSQSAVSRQIAQLERALGAKLFEQIGRAVHLADAGRAFLRHAERILGDLERAAEIGPALANGRHARLRIGASTTPGFYLLPAAIGRFHREFPEVELGFTIANTTRIEEMLVRNELDLAFVGAHLTSGDLHLEPFAEDEIVCFAHPRHRLAKKRRVAPEELAHETLVTREEGSATRRLFEGWLTAAGGGAPRSIALGCPEAVKALVAAGVGFGFLSRFGLRDEIARGRLAILHVAAPRLRRPLSVVRHPQKERSPAMEAFLDLARAHARKHARASR